MLINQTSEYALRGMAILAIRWPDTRITAAEISEQAHIPFHYVSKVMRRMVTAGLVQAQRGHGGGFRLSRPPDEITLLQVLEATDFELDAARCAFGFGNCDPDNPCPLHPAFSVLNAGFATWAASTRLSSVEGPNIRLMGAAS